MIHLPCKPSDSLDWDLSSFTPEKPPLLKLDLGLEEPFFPIDDEMHFQALSLALRKVRDEKIPTSGIVLYKGSADFARAFAWSEKQKENFRMCSGDENLFCADAFVHYFQMLSYSLPDEAPVYICLDIPPEWGLAKTHRLLSKERFEHFQVSVKNVPTFHGLHWTEEGIVKPEFHPHAFCMPLAKTLDDSKLKRLDSCLGQMPKPFRVIHEAFLTEDWEGVETLHVLQESLSPLGTRKLQGFLAAGGEVHQFPV